MGPPGWSAHSDLRLATGRLSGREQCLYLLTTRDGFEVTRETSESVSACVQGPRVMTLQLVPKCGSIRVDVAAMGLEATLNVQRRVGRTRATHQPPLPCADPPRESAPCGSRPLLGPRQQLARVMEPLLYLGLETNRTWPRASGAAFARAVGTTPWPRVGVGAPPSPNGSPGPSSLRGGTGSPGNAHHLTRRDRHPSGHRGRGREGEADETHARHRHALRRARGASGG
jgi:hypothetical protein